MSDPDNSLPSLALGCWTLQEYRRYMRTKPSDGVIVVYVNGQGRVPIFQLGYTHGSGRDTFWVKPIVEEVNRDCGLIKALGPAQAVLWWSSDHPEITGEFIESLNLDPSPNVKLAGVGDRSPMRLLLDKEAYGQLLEEKAYGLLRELASKASS